MRSNSALHRSLASLALAFALSTLGACGAPVEADSATMSEEPVSDRASAVVVTCPDPKSCGGWSAWYNIAPTSCTPSDPACDVEICRPCHCTIDRCDTCCTVRQRNNFNQTQESFRDCKLKNGNPCREKREQVVSTCGGC